jgi:hypothetical protein
MPLARFQRLASIDDLLRYRVDRLFTPAWTMLVRLFDGGYRITRCEWAVLAKLYENGGFLPSVLAEQMHRDRARTSFAQSRVFNLPLNWPGANRQRGLVARNLA